MAKEKYSYARRKISISLRPTPVRRSDMEIVTTTQMERFYDAIKNINYTRSLE